MPNELPYATAREVKKVLAPIYGFKNVGVASGRGTARGWVDVHIGVKRGTEREEIINIGESVRKLLKAKFKFYTYCSDDGFDTDRDCLLIQVIDL